MTHERPVPGLIRQSLDTSASEFHTRTAQLQMLIEMGRDLMLCHNQTTLLGLGLAHALRFTGYEGGSVLLYRPEENLLEVRAAAGFDVVPIGTKITNLQNSIAGQVFAKCKTIQLQGRGEALGSDWRTYTKPIPASISLPILISQSEAIGVLALKTSEAIPPLTDDDVSTLELLAGQLAAAIRNVQYSHEREELIHQIAEHKLQQQALIARLLASHEEERRRLAYELHDGLAQQAASTHQHLQAFAGHYRPRRPRVREELKQALDLARLTVKEARLIIAGLRPTTLDDFGLGVALRLEIEALSAVGWNITFEDGMGAGRLPTTIETTLFRVAQEALQNIRKHAQTTTALLSLQRHDTIVRLTVQDWGCGFDTSIPIERMRPGERMGLLSIYERVSLIGGQCQITSRIGEGTCIVIDVPIPREEHTV